MDKISLILVLGGPGSGKSTVSSINQNLIKKSLHLKTGQIMRNVVVKDDKIATKDKDDVNLIMQNGGLVKDDIVGDLLSKEIDNIIAGTGTSTFILDGYPRTLPQLQFIMAKAKVQINIAFILTAPHSIMEKRCKMRNLRTDRVDDRKGPVEHRINEYLNHVSAIREELKAQNVIVIDVDTCDPMDKMTKIITENLKKLKLC